MANLPVFIMVRTQMAENIGVAARAMMNCGVSELRLVAPREDCLSPAAVSMAAGAGEILKNAKVFPSLAEAVADLNFVYATSARPRDMVYEVFDGEGAAAKLCSQLDAGLKCGVLFGPERTGLLNDELTFADAVIEIPLNPANTSLNVAQAVLLVGYEYFKHSHKNTTETLHMPASRVATKEEIFTLFQHLEAELDKAGYFRIPEKRPRMLRNLRNIFTRSHLSLQEVNTLHGIINELVRLQLCQDDVCAMLPLDTKEQK
ncbi:MAG: RNA methyltransferase [Alphaproteobacteria bacterium]|nr:RNA methyltransferase [Alphaproteobacteria bacterium]